MRTSWLVTGGAAMSAAIAGAAAAQGDTWKSQFRVGQQVDFSVSERPEDFQRCAVTENSPGSVMRVRCQAFKTWAAGNYIVYGPKSIRAAGSGDAAASPARARAPATPSRAAASPGAARQADRAAAAPAAGGGLRVGEYACYGGSTGSGSAQVAGGRSVLLAGLGFKVQSGNRYVDLDGKNPGSFSVSGSTVTFRGGIHGGETGRNLTNGSFVLGSKVRCEPW
jgi:hypothetical protein